MKYVIGIIIVWFLCSLFLSLAYFSLLLINELAVMVFDVDPLKWLKREIFEPVGQGLFELIHKQN
jgi:hypothetical protein|nr:MAG TPA: Picornavirus 2B protein [Caudoviricetes sp.]